MSKDYERESVPYSVTQLFKEIDRVVHRFNKMTDRVNDDSDEYLSSRYDKLLQRGTKEGAAFKRALKDLRMQVSETIQDI